MQFSIATIALFVAAAIASPVEAVQERGVCTPGDYGCEAGNTGKILVCNAAGSWQLSSICGAGRCRETNGNPFCV